VGANHRKLSTYVNVLSRNGLYLTEMVEPEPPMEWTTTERRDAARFPVFLVARCVKQDELERSGREPVIHSLRRMP
jgi:hypothetical protein